ncbi:aspartate/glutamate racemase family protein [Enterococcus bulliens]
MQKFFTILGGMGTIASEHFVHRLNLRTDANCDQEYLDYALVNHATIPDRTDYLLDSTKQNPLDYLQEDINQFSKLNPMFFVLTCNTAHVFFNQLQQSTSIPILHMPEITVSALKKKTQAVNDKKIIILATKGTLNQQIYQRLLKKNKLDYIVPTQVIQEKVTHLIYKDIKEKNYLNFKIFKEILAEINQEYTDCIVILGCTELSYIYSQFKYQYDWIIDAQEELITEILSRMQN